MIIGTGFLPENIFLVVAYASKKNDRAEISIVQSIAEVNMKLEELTYGNVQEDEIKVYNGIITSCLYLPESFHGIIPHILVVNDPKFSEELEGLDLIYEDDEDIYLNNDNLYRDIEDAVFVSGPPDQKGMAEKIEMFVSENNVKIDDILLFFGYELTPIMQIPEESYDDDEEMIQRLGSIKNEILSL